jgi:hypothetical protein
MDLFGKVVREYLKQAEADSINNATALIDELLEEKMTKGQIREMLYASGFEKEIVEAAMRQVFPGR